jgi:NAD(P)-dependent dehydrogenase (short-subunit alcohol dehydrogenase family)
MLKGKSAIVTGSTSGIGLGIARALVAQGANVMLNGFGDAAAISALQAELGKGGAKIAYSGADMTKPEEIAGFIAQAEAEVGAVDILVNNAGIQFRKPMVELATADWPRVIDTNLTSAFMIGREAAKRMIARGHGKVINIGSLTS